MDFSLIEDEKFDFDLPLSPDVEDGYMKEEVDDDEIFFGPVGHMERCVATHTEAKTSKICENKDDLKPMSPLNAEQIVEIFKEATSMAFMLKSTSTAEDQNELRPADYPELINDVRKTDLSVLRNREKENLEDVLGQETSITHNNDKANLTVEMGQQQEFGNKKILDSNDENFVVHKRVLKERNPKVPNGKPVSPGSLVVKSGMVERRSKNKLSKPASHVVKLHMAGNIHKSPLKVNNMLIYGVMDSPKQEAAKISGIVTPRKSSASSHADRSFSSTKSSSTSDTSFTEDTKTSKLLMPSKIGLKRPGFTSGRRRRTSSNSSTSSTSSIPPFNPNETFVISKVPSTEPTAKQPVNQKKPVMQTRPIPASKDSLTKVGKSLSKPTFAKPSDVPKVSTKLQPMKALPRIAAVTTKRSASASVPRSPVLPTVCKRAASVGATPKRGQTPKVDGTPAQRRSIAMSSAGPSGTPIRGRKGESTEQKDKPKLSNPSTPRYGRKSITIPPGNIGTPKVSGAPNPVAKRRISGVVKAKTGGTAGATVRSKGTAKPVTPGSTRTSMAPQVTPPNTGHKPCKAMSATSNKRRSLLPTPSFIRTKSQSRSRLCPSMTSAPVSPVPFQMSPSVTAKPRGHNLSASSSDSLENPIVLEMSPTSSTDSKEPETGSLNQLSEIAVPFENSTMEISKDYDDNNSFPEVQGPGQFSVKEPISDVFKPKPQDTPLMKDLQVEDYKDPFSPGFVSPGLPQESCLNPVVLQLETADLIDLSHETPKRLLEVNLIDLAGNTPMNTEFSMEKLVDI